MPNYTPLLTSLGVITGQQNGEYNVSLITDAPDAVIRKSIYKGDAN